VWPPNSVLSAAPQPAHRHTHTRQRCARVLITRTIAAGHNVGRRENRKTKKTLTTSSTTTNAMPVRMHAVVLVTAIASLAFLPFPAAAAPEDYRSTAGVASLQQRQQELRPKLYSKPPQPITSIRQLHGAYRDIFKTNNRNVGLPDSSSSLIIYQCTPTHQCTWLILPAA